MVSRLKYLGCQKIQVEIRLALFSMKGILNHKQLHHKCGFGCLSKCKSIIFQGSKLCICTSNLCSMIHPIHAANPSNLCSMTCHIQAMNIYLRPSNGGNFQQRGWKFQKKNRHPGCHKNKPAVNRKERSLDGSFSHVGQKVSMNLLTGVVRHWCRKRKMRTRRRACVAPCKTSAGMILRFPVDPGQRRKCLPTWSRGFFGDGRPPTWKIGILIMGI